MNGKNINNKNAKEESVNLVPTDRHLMFLNLAYNKFLDIKELILSDSFMTLSDEYRLFKVQQLYSIYSELLRYEPLKEFKGTLKKIRPPEEAIIGYEFFDVIRHIVSHFQFYDRWNDIEYSKDLILWNGVEGSIHRYMMKYEGKTETKFRIWNDQKKEFIYVSIKYPDKYSEGKTIKLSDLINEHEGLIFSTVIMTRILMTQVKEIS